MRRRLGFTTILEETQFDCSQVEEGDLITSLTSSNWDEPRHVISDLSRTDFSPSYLSQHVTIT
jgi:hypothetical protein